MDLNQLIAQRKATEDEIILEKSRVRAAVMAQIDRIVKESGLTPREVFAPLKNRMRAVPVKYRDNDGNAWTGRGKQPVWLRTRIAQGVPLESFQVAA